MGFLTKTINKITGMSHDYGWLTGGEMPYAEQRVGEFVNNVTGQTDAFNKSQDATWAMWNANNAYNSPVNQMQLYRQAGINPNLVAQSGMHSYASGSAPSMSAGGGSILSLLSTLFGIKADMALKGAQARLTNAQAQSIEDINAENADLGTTKDTPTPVKLGKAAKQQIVAAAEGLASSGPARAMTDSQLWNTIDDVFSGSYDKNLDFYRYLPTKKAKNAFKQKLKDLRGYTDRDFKGWD